MSGTNLTSGTFEVTRASEYSRRLKAAAGRFDTFFRPLEPVFLNTGERLRELHGKVAALSQKAEAAGALLSSGEFAAMLGGLTEAARHIDALRQRRGGLATALGRITGTTDTMLASLNALNRIMFHVRVLAVNAKIEASQLNSAGTDFSVFTREIARLAHCGDETIGAVRQELTGLRAAAAEAHTLQRTFEDKGLPELDAVAGRLAASIAGMHERQGRVTHGVKDIPQRLAAVFAHIADLVSDLQIYDITRQRLEHVEQALSVAADMIDAEASTMGPQQRLVFVNGIADLQARQLGHTEEHYQKAVADVGRSLAAMARGVPAVGAACEQTFGGAQGTSLPEIEGDLKTASAVFAEFAATRERAEGSLGHVVAAAGRAGDLIRSLNSVNGDMRLMGLNASIKCGNLGGLGRALNVIAQELQGYATLTRTHVESVATDLGRIATAASEIGLTGGAADGTEIGALKSALDQAVERLRRTGSDVGNLLDGIGSLGGAVVALTHVTDQGFSGQVDCRAAVEQCLRELRALAADSDTGLRGEALEEARREVLAFMESHYTMASERAIHGSAIGSRAIVDLLTGDSFADSGARGGARAGDCDQTESDNETDISGLLF